MRTAMLRIGIAAAIICVMFLAVADMGHAADETKAQVPVYLHYAVAEDSPAVLHDQLVDEDQPDDNRNGNSGIFSGTPQTGDYEDWGAWCFCMCLMVMGATAIMLSLIKSFSFNSRKRRKGD